LVNKLVIYTVYIFSNLFRAIRPGITSAVLQSAAQYFWFTVNGNLNLEPDKNGWILPLTPFWYELFISEELK